MRSVIRMSTPPMLTISLFGGLRVLQPQEPSAFAPLPRTVNLLAYLLLHQGRPIPRAQLAFTLWPDVPEADARARLRRHLHDLRRTLPAIPPHDYLAIDAMSVAWLPHPQVWVDVAAFEQLLDADRPEEAVALYVGELLPTLDEGWLLVERERLHARALHALAAARDRARAAGDLARAADYAEQLLQSDPLSESAACALMQLRALAGDRVGALRLYELLAQRLREELGVAPLPETTALRDQLALNPHPASAGSHSPRRARTVPGSLTPLIGRTADIAAVLAALTAPEHPIRVLTLTGSGGAGKTRLALAIATEIARDPMTKLADVVFIALADVHDPALVLPRIAAALDLSDAGVLAPLDLIVRALHDRPTLLVLDNCEHLRDAVPLLVQLLTAAPDLRILATSRVPLGIEGEHEHPVPPLELPTLDDLPSPEQLAICPSVALFLARVRAITPAFALTSANAADIAAICVALDGLPLAIELAAARCRVLAPADLRARLAQRLDLLVNPTRTAPPRQHTLRATIDWSFDLLTSAEQTAFVGLAVFHSGCSLTAAAHVLGSEGAQGEIATLDLLTSLVRQSLLGVVQGTDGPRFTLLETVRAYALERAAAHGQLDALRDRHLDWVVAHITALAAQVRGPDPSRWLDQIATEQDNARAALAWAVARPELAEHGLQLAAALGWFWRMRGALVEGQTHLRRALDAAAAHQQTPAYVAALDALGVLAFYRSAYPAAQAAFERSRATRAALGDEVGLARTEVELGITLWYTGDVARAQCLLERGRARAATINASAEEGLALVRLGFVAGQCGDRVAAQALIERGMAHFDQRQDVWGVSYGLSLLAETVIADPSSAYALYERCLPAVRAAADTPNLAYVLANLAGLALVNYQLDRAAAVADEALALFDRLGDPWQPPRLLRVLGYLALAAHDYDRAGELCRASLERNLALHDRRGVLASLVGLAAILLARRHGADAAWLLGAVEGICERSEIELLPTDQYVAGRLWPHLREHLGSKQTDERRYAGRTTSLDVALALVDQRLPR
jgi:predicted ATPase/DNA-binding SARP family transcriptional activator